MYSSIRFTDLVTWTGGRLVAAGRADFLVRAISSDTRTIQTGEVFVALRGEQFDGSAFVADAVQRGASAVITEKPPETPLNVPCLVVEDALGAWIKIAEKVRDKFQGPVVAITGSAGKSSTKEMVAKLLGPDTVASPASFNNLLGVSKTICLISDSTRSLVLEMGMNAPGEIREMCVRFKPHFGLITNIGDAHIGKLGGAEGIYRAKKELFDYLAESGQVRGIALNVEDPMVVKAWKEAFTNGVKTVRYSADPAIPADVWVKEKTLDAERGSLRLTIQVDSDSFTFNPPIFGMHHAQNIAASIAIANLANVPLAEIRNRLSLVQAASHRGQIMELSEGRILIDESYNSNPSALLSSLSSLAYLNPSKLRVLVLGDMLELGQFSLALHEKVGNAIAQTMVGMPLTIIGVGKETEALLAAVRKSLPQCVCQLAPNAEAATDLVRSRFAPGSLCLIKGSRGMKLDRVVDALRRTL